MYVATKKNLHPISSSFLDTFDNMVIDAHLPHFNYTSCLLPSAKTHIRILVLHPSNTAATSESPDRLLQRPLVCDLYITPISNPMPYQALSYTWGADDRASFMQIAGANFAITSSLDAALRHIRKQDEAIPIWIDQICIDQSNDSEKGDQVMLMTDIYTKAEQVLAWLGPAADRSDEVMDLWNFAGQKALELGIDKYYTKEKVFLLQTIMADPLHDDPLAKPLHEFVEATKDRFEELLPSFNAWSVRRWFYRVWIVQELSLCPRTVLVCGYKAVAAEHVTWAATIQTAALTKILQACSTVEARLEVMDAQSYRARPLLSTRNRRQKYDKGVGPGDELFRLLRIMFVETHTGATNKRDRIYGLLGLAVDAPELGIKSDYVCRDAGPIFTSVARALIRKGHLGVLSFSQFPKEDDLKHVPSWVSDWRPKLDKSYYTIYENAEDHLLTASGETKVTVVPTEDLDVLALAGYIVDVIDEVGAVWHEWEEYPKWQDHLDCIADFYDKSRFRNETGYTTTERHAQAAWRVPIGDLYRTLQTDHTRASERLVKDDYNACMAVLEIQTAWPTMTSEQQQIALQNMETLRSAAGTYRMNMGIMTGKRPYLTQKGYVGMGAHLAQEGDVVVVFSGARLPYILRPSGPENDFTFVGEAYCDGIMDGEILQRSKEEILHMR